MTYNCNICQYQATQKSNLSSHIKSVHFKERFPCKICDYEATGKGHLSRHVKNVHQKSENVNCTECNKSIQRGGLTQHMKIFHTGEQTQFKCNICTFETIYKYNLYMHVRSVHQKVKK